MPLKKDKSAKAIKANIKELLSKKSSKKRAKAEKTYAKRTGKTSKEAKQGLAIVIALSKAGKLKKKS
jgi:hypothetical protein